MTAGAGCAAQPEVCPMIATRACIVWLALVAGGGMATGAPTKYRRAPPIAIGQRAPRPPPAPPASGPAGPSVGVDGLAIEGAVDPIRDEQIALLEKLIADTPDADATEKADLYFRLGDLYAQRQRYHRLQGIDDELAAARAPRGDRAALEASRRDHVRAARTALAKAIATYRTLADTAAFRAYPRMDRALFALAFALGQAGNDQDARVVWKRLLDEHPQSVYVAEANLAFADYFFGAGELASAEAFYRKVLQFPRSRVYGYANYRLGWVFLNLGRAADAGQQFLQVMRDTAGDPAQATLHGAAKKDFVRAFADFGQVQKAWDLFARLDRASAPAMVALLADLYLEQGKSDRAVLAFRQLLVEVPDHTDVCLWQAHIARAMLSTRGARDADKAAEVERLARLYGALASRRQVPAAALAECRDEASALTGELARAWHDEGHRTRNLASLDHAARLYDVYLATFPDAPDAGETQYFAAELRWLRADLEPDARTKTQRWEEAATAFSGVVTTGKAEPRLVAESACAAVLGWKNALDVDPRRTIDRAPAAADDAAIPTPRPIPDRVRHMLAAFDPCIATRPAGDDDAVGLQFMKADTLRRYDHLDEALPLLEAIIARHPGHETAYYAANLALDILVITHRHDVLARFAHDLAARPAFFTARPDQDRAPLVARLRDIEHKARRDRAQALEQAGQFVACGQAYLDLFNDDPEAPRADEVLYSAGVCFEEGRSLSTAIEAFSELRRRFATSPHAARALARLGGIYGRVAYYDRAAASFEQYARDHASAQDAYDLMNDAVIYRRGLGDDEAAIADTRYFIARFARQKPAAAADAFFSLASIHEKRGDRARLIQHYRDYLRRYRAAGGVERALVAFDRLGQLLWEDSCPVATVDGSCVKVVRERALAGRGALRRAGGQAQCGPASKIKLTVVARDRAKVKAARAAFASAVEAYEGAGGTFTDERLARHHYAQARFHQVEADYEAFLANPFPRDLDFDASRPAELARARQRFEAWFRGKDQAAGRLAARYTELVARVQDPATAIAASARYGQIQQHFADTLYTAPIPSSIRAYDEAVDAYCGYLEEWAAPLDEAALVGFGECLKASTRFGWFSSWSRTCERELGQLRPGEFPAAAELRAEPVAEPAVRDVEPSIASLD